MAGVSVGRRGNVGLSVVVGVAVAVRVRIAVGTAVIAGLGLADVGVVGIVIVGVAVKEACIVAKACAVAVIAGEMVCLPEQETILIRMISIRNWIL